LRRVVGFVLVGLGVFAIALGLLLKLSVYPKLAKAPLDPKAVSVATGQGMTALVIVKKDDGSLSPEIRQNLELTASRYVTGDLTQPEISSGGDVESWIEAVQVVDQDGNLVKATERQVCLDRFTQQAVEPCTARYVRDATDPETFEAVTENDVAQPGLSLKFPFDTEKRAYPVYDLTLRSAPEARFDGEDTVNGLDVYRFVQDIAPAKVGERTVPGTLVGSGDASVTADLYYQNKRTMWVEPQTGQIVKGSEQQHQELVQDGQSPGQGTIVLDGTLTFNDETVNKQVADAKSNKSKLFLLTTMPVILWIAGVVFLVAGLALIFVRRFRGGDRGEPAPPQEAQLTTTSS
jgi:hypothetical protein